MALGARAAGVTAMVVRQGATVVAAGLLAGLAGALALTRFLAALLFEVSPTDPATFAVLPLVLLAVAALASWLPARRAARTDPRAALRAE
jgi:ABC-type antimicrobial peptide transport system permease subunit